MTLHSFKMKNDAVYMVPLGGCGVFGANMTLYGYNGKWIMVDCGMGFADDTMPGIEILLPDPTFAESLGDDLLGIVLTHGHEDHIGAIDSLWPRFRKRFYATKFTAERVKKAVSETTWGNDVRVDIVPSGGKISLGDFEIEFVSMAHSIPEANALAITVAHVGTILHTGDWKLDPDPVVGNVTDEKRLTEIGNRGILALVGDSTNAMVPGHSGSERNVMGNLVDLFSEFKGSAILLTCFSTNVARMRSVHEAARKNGRYVCLIGRSLWNIDEAARKSGYLSDIPPFLTDKEADTYPAENLVYICTGSQGEPRAALARISNDDHKAFRLHEGDVVIFSSRDIPGNERAIDRIKNRLYARGVNIVTAHDAPVHVSGHPYRDELKALYKWTKPLVSIPVHGEQMQLEKHAALAKECGVTHTLIPSNGKVIEISAAGARVTGEVESGILAIEGTRIVRIDHEAIQTRKRIMWNGSAIVTIVVDRSGDLLAPPKITALGLLDENSDVDVRHIREAEKAVAQALKNAPKSERMDDQVLSEIVRVTARKFFQERFDRKPQTRVHLVRI